jgi:hypothetical protein
VCVCVRERKYVFFISCVCICIISTPHLDGVFVKQAVNTVRQRLDYDLYIHFLNEEKEKRDLELKGGEDAAADSTDKRLGHEGDEKSSSASLNVHYGGKSEADDESKSIADYTRMPGHMSSTNSEEPVAAAVQEQEGEEEEGEGKDSARGSRASDDGASLPLLVAK